MVKLSEGTSTSSGGSTTVHSLARKTHLCVLPTAWLLERVHVATRGPPHQPSPYCCYHGDPFSPRPPAPTQVGLAPQPHLVKRSQGLGP